MMPLVPDRPSPRQAARRYRHAIADVIYTAMTGVLNVPNDDRFMVITEHDQASKANAKATVPARTRKDLCALRYCPAKIIFPRASSHGRCTNAHLGHKSHFWTKALISGTHCGHEAVSSRFVVLA
jgi:hypothetical protein